MPLYKVSYTFTDGGPASAWIAEAESPLDASRRAFALLPPEKIEAISFCAVGLACEKHLPPNKRGWVSVTWPPFPFKRPGPQQLDLFT